MRLTLKTPVKADSAAHDRGAESIITPGHALSENSTLNNTVSLYRQAQCFILTD